MRIRRRIALFLGPQRVRFLGMTIAGVLLIGLTATAEHGAAALGLAYVMRAGQSAAAGFVGGPTAASEAATPIPAPTPSPFEAPAASATPRAGQLPVPSTAAPSPVPVTAAPSSPPAATPTIPPPATTPSPTEPPRGGAGAAPSTATPTPALTPLSFRVDTGATPWLFQVSAIVPGDTWTRDATVTNTGSVSFRYVFVFTQSASSLLWTDPDGLFVRVTSGSTVLYDGPASAAGQISAPNTVAPGASDVLRFVFSLPVSADDRLQGLAQDLQIVFTATQTP